MSLSEESYTHALFITRKQKLKSDDFIFGTYSVVQTNVLSCINVKYISSFKELIEFLIDLPHLKHKPCMLAIDDISEYFPDKEYNEVNFSANLHLLINILKTSALSLSPDVFSKESLLVSYTIVESNSLKGFANIWEFVNNQGDDLFLMMK